MNDKIRFFEVTFFPEGKVFKEERVIEAEDGLRAIEKIREIEGQETVIYSINEVPNPKTNGRFDFADNHWNTPKSFNFMGANNQVILKLEPNGDIYVNGRLAENDKEVVDGLRDFLSGVNKPYWRD